MSHVPESSGLILMNIVRIIKDYLAVFIAHMYVIICEISCTHTIEAMFVSFSNVLE